MRRSMTFMASATPKNWVGMVASNRIFTANRDAIKRCCRCTFWVPTART